MEQRQQRLDLLADVVARARRAGADAADAVLVEGAALSVGRRLDRPESLERSEGADLGLRVFIGRRQAIVSSSDLTATALADLVGRAVAAARLVPEDSFCGLADPVELARSFSDLGLAGDDEPTVERLTEWAARAEDAARAVPGVTNSEGAEAGWGRTAVAMAASNGFAGAYARSSYSISVSVLAGTGTAMERDYDYTAAVAPDDLKAPEAIGRSAGERAVRRLKPRKAATARVPVVFEPRTARSLVGHLASAVNGAAVARGTTFLRDKLGAVIFPETVSIVDDPLRRRGLRSRPFDGEGLATARRAIVDRGRLASWILDLRSARQLGLKSTGHAERGTSTPPAPGASNLYLEAGSVPPAQLMADIREGLYVTDLIGFGVNGVTGDFSRGAAGFWIVNGALAHPVSEMTVAGNLNQMFAGLVAADDLEFRYGIDAPTVRIDGLTVAGR